MSGPMTLENQWYRHQTWGETSKDTIFNLNVWTLGSLENSVSCMDHIYSAFMMSK